MIFLASIAMLLCDYKDDDHDCDDDDDGDENDEDDDDNPLKTLN